MDTHTHRCGCVTTTEVGHKPEKLYCAQHALNQILAALHRLGGAVERLAEKR